MRLQPNEKEDSWVESFQTREALAQWTTRNIDVLARRRTLEQRIGENLANGKLKLYPGFCQVCQRPSLFTCVNQLRAPGGINWRESLICVGSKATLLGRMLRRQTAGCGLNSRQRLSVDILDQLLHGETTPYVYLTEQVTPTAAALRKRFSRLVFSEYLDGDISSGKIDARGIRHENLTHLSFGPNSFDAVVCLDVLEHIANYRQALVEIHRILKPGGVLVASVPFALNSDKNIVRAIVRTDESIEHILPAEYHGDPLNPTKGILCYYHFGWALLDDLRSTGFTDSTLRLTWSQELAYIGHEQPVVIATA